MPESRRRLLARDPSSLRGFAVICAVWAMIYSSSFRSLVSSLCFSCSAIAGVTFEQRAHRLVVMDAMDRIADQARDGQDDQPLLDRIGTAADRDRVRDGQLRERAAGQPVL